MNFLEELKRAKKSAIVDNNLKKILYELCDGRILVEEYNLETNVVSRRAWKNTNSIQDQEKWEIELGDPDPNFQEQNQEIIKENSSQPMVRRRNTRCNLEWRISNLSYPIETYSISCDEGRKCLTVRTSNKKYFKHLNIPELERLNILPKQENVSFSHRYNTLIISYKKPQILMEMEKKILEIVKDVPVKPQVLNGGDNCKPS